MWIELSESTSIVVVKNDTTERTSAYMPGDFIIGILFSVRHQPKQKRTGGANHFLTCGEVSDIPKREILNLNSFFLLNFLLSEI